MASALQATNQTITAILGTIQTVSHTTQRSINTLAAGLDMVDTYVDGARSRQVDKHLVDKANYRHNLILESSLEQARKLEAQERELSGNAKLTAHFNSEFTRLSALFVEPTVTP